MEKEDPFNDPFFTDPNYFKKAQRKYIIYISLIALFGFGVSFLFVQKEEKHTKELKSYIGKKAVIGKDTLIIIDYSNFKSTYKLSNGIDFDMDFIKSKTIN